MKSTRFTLVVSATIFLTMLWARLSPWATELSAHGRYYLVSMLTISGIVTLIAFIRLVRPPHAAISARHRQAGPAEPQQREHFRLQFDASPQPRFVQKSGDAAQAPEFSCPVGNISETGISLLCSGVFDQGQTVQGEIVFTSGRTAPINGVVLRVDAHRTSLRLHCTIDPPLLMVEQRELIARGKERSPRPAFSEALLDAPARSLPSHSPKGICRLKRP